MNAQTIAGLYLSRGEPIPLDVAAMLMAEGIDVSYLERRYGKKERKQ